MGLATMIGSSIVKSAHPSRLPADERQSPLHPTLAGVRACALGAGDERP
jgi:hypothetical protein